MYPHSSSARRRAIRGKIDAALVARLVRTQFPHWSGLPITAAEPNGWDNRTFRLGRELLVRLPSAERYAAQVRKEHRWLPIESLDHLRRKPSSRPSRSSDGSPG